MRTTIHDGELKRYAVHIKCISHPKLTLSVPQGSKEQDWTLVFATSPDEAKIAAVEKVVEKFYRNRGLRTRWITTDEPIES